MRSDVIQIRWYSSGGWKTKNRSRPWTFWFVRSQRDHTLLKLPPRAERKAQSCRGHTQITTFMTFLILACHPKWRYQEKPQTWTILNSPSFSCAESFSELCGMEVSYLSYIVYVSVMVQRPKVLGEFPESLLAIWRVRGLPLVSGCSLSGNGVTSSKTCPHLLLKSGKKTSFAPWLKHRTQVRQFTCVHSSPAAQQVWEGVSPLEKNGKIIWVKWGMQSNVQGSQTLCGERRGRLKEGIVQEEPWSVNISDVQGVKSLKPYNTTNPTKPSWRNPLALQFQ